MPEPLPRAPMIFSSPAEGAAADEQDVRRVHLQEFLLRMLAPALRRHGCDRAFHDLQQRLLHALAAHVPCDARIIRFAADLIDLIDIDDAALRPLNIVIRRLQQLEDDVLHILAHIAGLGQRGRVRHGERHVQDPGQGLGQQRLAAAGGAHQHDVGLGDLDVVVLLRMRQPFVMVVHRHREHTLGVILADHVIVQNSANLLRRGHPVPRLHEVRLMLLANDVHAKLDALVADEHGGARDKLANLMLRLAAERAVQGVLRVAGLAHALSCPRRRPRPSRYYAPCFSIDKAVQRRRRKAPAEPGPGATAQAVRCRRPPHRAAAPVPGGKSPQMGARHAFHQRSLSAAPEPLPYRRRP